MMRVLTYNIRGGYGMDNFRSTRRIADVIRSLEADIVCLQEVHQRLPWTAWINQPGILHRHLRMKVVYQRNIDFGFGGYGNAILTRYPVLNTCEYRFPSTRELRGALCVQMAAPESDIYVFCTHLGLNQEERLEHVNTLTEIIAALQGKVILAGDMNETAESPAVQLLLKNTDLRDAGKAKNMATYPSLHSRKRLDYIFHSSNISLVSMETISSTASDHLPVTADLSI